LPEGVVAASGAALARRTLELDELRAAAERDVPQTPEEGDEGPFPDSGLTVAAYVSIGAEPATGPLLEALRTAGVRVLLPVLLPDNDLDWAPYEGPGRLVRAGRGLREPAAAPLGPEAVTEAGVVLLPGLAVDRRGLRLGRGGGSYDRVLARLELAGADPALVVLLYDTEVLATVPAEPHDRLVHAAVTPSEVHRFARPGRTDA
jgi:5-formyltetrahydrofolate cyclo-ligase